MPFLPKWCPNPLGREVHEHLVTVAGFRDTDEVAMSKTVTRSLWTSRVSAWGWLWKSHYFHEVECRQRPYGDFLVNFLCKENWNIDTSGMLSKDGLLRLSLTCTKEETISNAEVSFASLILLGFLLGRWCNLISREYSREGELLFCEG